MAASGKDSRAIERIYGHFHRVLAALLLRLEDETNVTCLSAERPVFSGDYEDNTYAPAIYVTSTLAPYSAELYELQDVQEEALVATGRTRPCRYLLPPLLADDVVTVRVRR